MSDDFFADGKLLGPFFSEAFEVFVILRNNVLIDRFC